MRESSSELNKFLYALINVFLVLLGVVALDIWWQRHETQINQRLSACAAARPTRLTGFCAGLWDGQQHQFKSDKHRVGAAQQPAR